MATTLDQAQRDLHQMVASFATDPLGFVCRMYTWPIHNEPGPDAFQRDFLRWVGEQVRQRRFNGIDPVLPIRGGISSGHGPGKTVLTAWLTHWIMSTREYCRGTITANTNDQLERKTWAAVREWYQWLLNKSWFEINAKVMFRHGCRATWNVAPQSCAEENSEAFAGQHAKGSTSFYCIDEASAVPDKIWEVAEGGLATGEPMIFAFGNPTRNTGEFYRIAFGDKRERWHVRVLDSRESKFHNRALIQQWLEDYSGNEDADFIRVRVRGLPPNADELQYIPASLVHQAQLAVAQVLADEPLVCGVDVSGGGNAMTVAMFRKGFDARSIRPIVLTGEQTTAHDGQLVVAKLAQVLQEHDIAAMNIDRAFGAAIVARLRDMGYRQVFETNFGAPAPDDRCENLRAYMWKGVKDNLPRLALDQHDTRLAMDLCGPGYHLNKRNRLCLESKASMVARGVASPDRGDALALTYAVTVAPKVRRPTKWGAVSQSPFA